MREDRYSKLDIVITTMEMASEISDDPNGFLEAAEEFASDQEDLEAADVALVAKEARWMWRMSQGQSCD
jgi:galactitol-specific phosphotransferase system IIB component